MIGDVQPAVIPPPQLLWEKKFPSVVSGIFSFIQCLVTIVIIGCEVGSVLIDMVTATIYVGFWASLFFMVAWISQAASSCCCRGRGCSTYTLVIQCISIFFAACVIGFDAYYLFYPSTCFFSSTICSSSGVSRGLFYTSSNFNNIKIPLIKGQLAAGAVMFVLCIVYIIMYGVTSVRVKHNKQSPTIYPQVQNAYPMVPTVSNGIINAPPATYNRPIDPNQTRTTELVCPTCNTTMNMTAQKRLPV